MAYALLTYELSTGNTGVSIPAATWTTVPLNVEQQDTGADITLNGDGSFQPLAGTYRVRATVTLAGPAAATFGNFSGRFLQKAVTVIATVLGSNARILGDTTPSQRETNVMEFLGRFTTVGGLDFALQIYLNSGTSANMGLPSNNLAVNEVYALLELIKE